MTHRRLYLHSCVALVFSVSVCAQQAPGGDSLHTIRNPGGGDVVYGTIDNQHTAQTAMGFMLRQVHGHFGDRPQVSNVFKLRNSTSYGAFFTLIAKNEGGRAVAGEVIVSMPPGGQPAAAILSDDAGHFTQSQPALLRKLNEAWHAANSGPSASAGGATASAAPAAAMRRVTAGDRSVYITMPENWRLTSVAGGSVSAEGPRGEKLGLALMVQGIHDPRVRDQFATFRAPSSAATVVYPAGGDVFTAYVNVINQTRRNQHLPPATFHLTQSIPEAGGGIEAHFDVDLNDGFGERTATALIGELGGGGTTWAMTISGSSLPKAIAVSENDLLLRVIHSASQDSRVVQAEQGAVMEGIRQAGVRSAQQAQDADQRRIASSKAFDASMDNIDRQSKAMQNYTLDRSQIQDNDLNGRATVSNGLADALVRTDPQRYEVVPPSQFLKGVDY